jgi:hypothetical protein
MSERPSDEPTPVLQIGVLDCYLVEATREAVVVGTWGETRRVSSELTFERFRRSGYWRIVHADGSITAARRGKFAHRSGPVGSPRE